MNPEQKVMMYLSRTALATATKIASATRQNRVTVYRAVRALEAKGIIRCACLARDGKRGPVSRFYALVDRD